MDRSHLGLRIDGIINTQTNRMFRFLHPGRHHRDWVKGASKDHTPLHNSISPSDPPITNQILLPKPKHPDPLNYKARSIRPRGHPFHLNSPLNPPNKKQSLSRNPNFPPTSDIQHISPWWKASPKPHKGPASTILIHQRKWNSSKESSRSQNLLR